MNHKIKRRWVNALRSGRYKQCFGKLQEHDSIKEKVYCALGVLAEVGELRPFLMGDRNTYRQLRELIGDDELEEVCRLNDQHCLSFDKIADWVEQKL